MRVLVAMSGGVDSSVAAARLVDEGHEVAATTMKLWGGPSDTGCCSVADVDDARRVADHLGIDHHVFNFSDSFDANVVGPYVSDHAAGRTPNPCIECNRHIKFDRLLRRARALDFEAVATGHHARVVRLADGTRRVARGHDRAKDQSYVLSMLGQDQLRQIRFPVGEMTKRQVRAEAAQRGLRTAAKPDSQDVCFIAQRAGRRAFLADRVALHPAEVVDGEGRRVGHVDAVELVTVGQRRGLGLSGGAEARFVTRVEVTARRVHVGGRDALGIDAIELTHLSWADRAVTGPVAAQCSAHGPARFGRLVGPILRFAKPGRPVAPGQTVALYERDHVVGAGIAA